MRTREKFGLRELARRTGMHREVLWKWTKDGVINPEGYRDYGLTQKAMWFTEKTVREVKFLKSLRKMGFSYQKIREAAKILRSYGHNPFSSGTFIAVTRKGKPISLIKIKDGKVIELVGKYKGELLLPLWEIEGENGLKEHNKICEGKSK